MANLKSLTVLISTHGRERDLSRCKEAIAKQVYSDFKCEVLVVPSSLDKNRFLHADRASGEFILFLDEDCELPDPHFLARAYQQILKSEGSELAIGGEYLSPESLSYSGEAYNSICNNWLRRGLGLEDRDLRRQAVNLLGGAFIVSKAVMEKVDLHESPVWGGEDTFLFRQLRSHGVQLFFSSTLSVYHHDASSLKKWLYRAFLHGYHKTKYKLDVRYFNLEWSLFRDLLIYLPYYILHFSTVYFASFLSAAILMSQRLKVERKIN